MTEAVDISWAKDKAGAELEGIFAEFVLAMAGGVGAFARNSIVATQQVEQVRAFQLGGAVCGAFGINEKRKCDASLFAEYTRIVKIAHPDGREISPARLDFTLMLAQLRDVLAAKHSAVVAQEYDHGWLRLPQRTEPDGTLVNIREHDFG